MRLACSEHPDKLIKFYSEVVGLTPLPMISPALPGGKRRATRRGHSEVKGQAREPQRMLITFTVVRRC
jgi:hypothetical protein